MTKRGRPGKELIIQKHDLTKASSALDVGSSAGPA